MKKQLLLLIMISFAASTFAAEVEIDGLWYEVITKAKEAKVISYKNNIKYSGNIVIPETVEYDGANYSVTSIGDNTFYKCTNLTSVTIPNSVTTIGERAFYGCNDLTSITIGNSVTSFGSNSFYGCNGLTSFTIPNSVTTIGERAFQDCSGLTSITIGNSVTSIGGNTFLYCSGLTSVYTSDLEAWCKITFENDYSNPLNYAHHLFLNGEEATDLVIPNSVTSIGERAFYGCSGLTSVTIPNSVTSIGKYAFHLCSGLTSVYISDLEAWCNVTFGNDSSNPLYSARQLFVNGEELRDLAIPNSVTNIGNYVFLNCSSLTSVTIPNSVTSIGAWTFRGCSGLTSITIPNSVTNIAFGAFSYCSGLTSITIPNSVTSIEHDAFCGCSGLTSITIPSSVTSIADGTFLECSGLTSVTIPNSVTSIGNWAFRECSKLTTITIGEGVETIYTRAFANCPELTDVYCYAENVPSMKNGTKTCTDAFADSYIEYATLHVPDGSISAYSQAEPWMNFKAIVKLDMPKYKLTYYVDGEVYKTYEIEEGATITPEPTPTKEGYTFSGWSEIPATMPAHDVTVTGTFSANKYKLIYKVDDAEYKTYELEYGATITPEPEPTKEGYSFSGWSWIPTKMPAEDVTVTGSFTVNKYKLTYIVDGEEYKSYEVEYGAAITPEPAPTKDGYTFSGWSEIPEIMPAHDVTVTGTFSAKKYKLIYKVDDAEYKIYELEYGATITPEPEPTKEGYTFSGWSWIPTKMPAEDVTVTGSFVVNKYKLIYLVDEEEYKVYEVDYGTAITPEPVPEKEGYIFLGWSEIPETMPAHDVTVTGSFTPNNPVFDNISYEITGEGVVVVSGENSSGSVVIPATVEYNGQTYQVIEIGEGAFKGNTAITSVSIDNGIIKIGASAFEGCSNLTEIVLGSDIVSIGEKAFANFASSSSVPRRADEYGMTIYCYPKSVPETATNAFENTPIDKALLLVYDEVINDYANAAPWSEFGTIQGFNGGTGIKSIWAGEGDNAKIYDLKGRRVVQPSKGLYIKNGKKYVVK